MTAVRTPLALPPAPVRQALTTPRPVRCLGGCGRMLTAAESIARGYGRTCAARVRIARKQALRAIPAPQGFTARQVAQARDLIEEDAIVPVRPRVWRTVSSDGRRTYLTALEACTCPAGVRGTPCYHRAAVDIVARATGQAAAVAAAAA